MWQLLVNYILFSGPINVTHLERFLCKVFNSSLHIFGFSAKVNKKPFECVHIVIVAVVVFFPCVNERASGLYLVLAGEPSVAEVQVLVGFPQAAQLPLQTHPFQLEGAQLPSQHGALSQQLRLQRQPLLLLGLEPAAARGGGNTEAFTHRCHAPVERCDITGSLAGGVGDSLTPSMLREANSIFFYQ